MRPEVSQLAPDDALQRYPTSCRLMSHLAPFLWFGRQSQVLSECLEKAAAPKRQQGEYTS